MSLVPDTQHGPADGAQEIAGKKGYSKASTAESISGVERLYVDGKRDAAHYNKDHGADKLIQVNQVPDVLQIVYANSLKSGLGDDPAGMTVSFPASPDAPPDSKRVSYRIEAGFPTSPDPLPRIIFSAAGMKGGDQSGHNWGIIVSSSDFVMQADGRKDRLSIDHAITIAHEVGHFLTLRHRYVKGTGLGDGLFEPDALDGLPANIMHPYTGVKSNTKEFQPQIDFDLAQVYVVHHVKSD